MQFVKQKGYLDSPSIVGLVGLVMVLGLSQSRPEKASGSLMYIKRKVTNHNTHSVGWALYPGHMRIRTYVIVG